MRDNDHQARSTRFSKNGTTVFVRLRVDRRLYEFARQWARLHHAAMPDGTAEDQLEGYLNTALTKAQDMQNWQCPPEIEALYPPSRPATSPNDLDDEACKEILNPTGREAPFPRTGRNPAT
jgi:hypothetical protein